MSSAEQLATLAAHPSVQAAAGRVSVATGFDPITIATIIASIIQEIMACKKPANTTDAKAVFADAAANHPYQCPFWLIPRFSKNGVRKLRDINSLWAHIVEDSDDNADEAATAVMAAAA